MVHLPRNKKAKNSFIRLQYKVSLSLLPCRKLESAGQQKSDMRRKMQKKKKNKVYSLMGMMMGILWDKIDNSREKKKTTKEILKVTIVPLLIIFLFIEVLT